MRKSITSRSIYLLFGAILFIVSCNEKDPLPVSKAGFEVQNSTQLEKSVPVKFVNLSTNAARFVWEFGDGVKDSINLAPSHVYDDAGSYDVTLRAITQDGQESVETKSIDIKTRVLVAFSVANISFVNPEGNPWDDDGTGPDLVFVFGAQSSASLDDYIITDTVNNLTPGDFPIDWNFNQGDGLELTNEPYDLVLLDADPEKESNPDVDPYDVMFGITIDPVNYEFQARDDNDNGLLQVSIGGFAIDLYLTFALQ